MRVLLINPPAENTLIGNNPVVIEEQRGVNPPLGILYVAAYIRARSAHSVEILDCIAEKISSAEIADIVRKSKPDLVGLTAMTFTMIDVLKAAKAVKGANPNIIVALGGPHPYLYPEETIAFEDIDFLVQGEGEETFLELINSINDKRELSSVKGIVFKADNNIIQTEQRGFIQDLDCLPYPARDMTDIRKYNSILSSSRFATTMITSRGCPFKCSFCLRPHLGKAFRARTPQNIVNEMETCIGMGIREFLIYDDTFSVDINKSKEICRRIIKRNLDISWDIRSRVDTIDEELLLLLKKARCNRIHYGVESGSNRILNILKKGITTQQAEHAVEKTRKSGIASLAYFMIGSPGETREEALKTIDFAIKLNPDFAHFTIFCPFPGTELYALALDKGIIKEDTWRRFSSNPDIDFKPPLWIENMSEEEMLGLLSYAYRSFYMRPAYICNRLLKLKSFIELKRQFHAAMSLIRYTGSSKNN